MKKAILLSTLFLLGGFFVAFMMDDDQRPKRGQDNRVSIINALEAVNLNFHKEIGQTSIIFQFAPLDSILLECEDCITHIANVERGGIRMSMSSIDGSSPLNTKSFGRYIPINSTNGKVGIVFERDGIGEKVLSVRKLKVLRKTRFPNLDVGGEPMGLLDINNLYVDKLTKENTEDQTTFFFKIKNDDKVKVDIIGANGAVPGNLICSMYKRGEEYDKKPIATGSELAAPPIDGGQDQFGFEFAHIKDVKGINAYHLDIYRIPLRSAGYKDIDTTVVDTTTEDTVVSEEVDPLLEFLKSLQDGPDFACSTTELGIVYNLPGRYNLDINRSNRICFDLQLTDECVVSEEGKVNDTLWAFWFGAGNSVINKFKYQDTTRKINGKEGLVEAYARSKKIRKVQNGSVFPEQRGTEGVFYAVIDQQEKSRFLDNAFNPLDWYGDQLFTVSSYGFVSTGFSILKHNPERPMSLCLCNNSAVSTVPILFKYQQFVTKPMEKDTTQKASGYGDYYDIDGSGLQ